MEDIISICLYTYIYSHDHLYKPFFVLMEKQNLAQLGMAARHGHCDFVLDGQYVRPFLPGR